MILRASEVQAKSFCDFIFDIKLAWLFYTREKVLKFLYIDVYMHSLDYFWTYTEIDDH